MNMYIYMYMNIYMNIIDRCSFLFFLDTVPERLFFESTQYNFSFNNLVKEISLVNAYFLILSHTSEPTSHESNERILLNDFPQISLGIIILNHFTFLEFIHHVRVHVLRVGIPHIVFRELFMNYIPAVFEGVGY